MRKKITFTQEEFGAIKDLVQAISIYIKEYGDGELTIGILTRYDEVNTIIESKENRKMSSEDEERAKAQAKSQFDNIADMIERLDKVSYDDDNNDEVDKLQEEIDNAPLCCEIITTYEILLCTGGPAVRIIGDLDDNKQPESANLQYQDWFTPWIDYYLHDDEEQVLLRFAQNFYFGE